MEHGRIDPRIIEGGRDRGGRLLEYERKGRISTKEEKEENIRRTERERIIEGENQHTVFI